MKGTGEGYLEPGLTSSYARVTSYGRAIHGCLQRIEDRRLGTQKLLDEYVLSFCGFFFWIALVVLCGVVLFWVAHCLFLAL